MKLTYFKCKVSNFGDDLNAYLWPKLMGPDFFDDDDTELFVGIGSILYDTYPVSSIKHVFGSGYGGYTAPPDIRDGSWRIAFLRGPRTAAILGAGLEKVVTDGAILLRLAHLPPPGRETGIVFIPHFHSLDRGNWLEVCALAGVRFVDPTASVETVLDEIRGASKVICESMHGAIVADALRVPWVAVKPIAHEHHFKWLDWADSLDIPLRQHALRPSTVREAWSSLTGGQGWGRASRRLGESRAAAPMNRAFKHIAARGLQRVAAEEPQLSGDAEILRATERAAEAVDALRKTGRRSRFQSTAELP